MVRMSGRGGKDDDEGTTRARAALVATGRATMAAVVTVRMLAAARMRVANIKCHKSVPMQL